MSQGSGCRTDARRRLPWPENVQSGIARNSESRRIKKSSDTTKRLPLRAVSERVVRDLLFRSGGGEYKLPHVSRSIPFEPPIQGAQRLP